MNDDELRQQLERRSQAASFRAEELLPEVRRWTEGGFGKPARFARWAPLAGLAAAAVIVLLVIIAIPRSPVGPASSPSSSPPGDTSTPAAIVQLATIDCGEIPAQPNGNIPAVPVTVADTTGVVGSCASSETASEGVPSSVAGPSVAAVDGQDAVAVAWTMQQCGPENVSIRVDPDGDAEKLTIVVDRLAAGGYACIDTSVAMSVVLQVPSAAVADLAGTQIALDVLAPDQGATRPNQLDCSNDPDAPIAFRIQLLDETGFVASCEPVAASEVNAPPVANPNGDLRVLDVNWMATPCEAGPTFYVGELSHGYFVHVGLPKAPCSQPPVAHRTRLHLKSDVAASDVLVQVDRDGPTTSGQAPKTVACVGASNVTIVDVLGVIQSCAASEDPAPLNGDLGFDNPDGDQNSLRISWMGAPPPCDYEVHLTQPSDEYELDIYEMDSSCRLPRVLQTVTLELTGPIDADQITTSSLGGYPNLTPPPSPTAPSAALSPSTSPETLQATPAPARGFECDDWNGNMPPVRLVDHTGLATGCSAALDTPYRSPPPSFANPDGNSFYVTFSFGCANDDKTTDLDLWARPDPASRPKFVLTADRRETTGGCLIDVGSRVVVLELSQPVEQPQVQVVDVEDGLSNYYQPDSTSHLDFNLEFKAGQDTYTTSQPIDALSTLQVINHESGSPTNATLGGSGSGLMAFGVEQLGTDLQMGPVWPADCRDYSVAAGEPLTQSLTKSGGFSGDDPNADFWRGWFADPEFHLPPGTWLLTAYANFLDGSCFGGTHNGEIQLNTSVVVEVTAR
ncbi:MAG TPA: hypothetical protein VH371_02290 [Candidatus Limnocylindrales bacterium]